jgi:hypothetical protein
MEKISISEITDTHIAFLKQNNLLKKIKFNLNNFDHLLNNINTLYKKRNDISVNNCINYNTEKINLIYYQKIDTNTKPSDLPKTLKIIEYIFENENKYFNDIIDNTKLTNEKKKEFINFFHSKNYNEDIFDWINSNGIEIINNLQNYFKNNYSFFNEIQHIDLYGSFISLDIQKHIESYFNCIYKYSYRFDNYSVESTFMTDSKTPENNFLKSIFIRSLVWLEINNKYNLDYKVWMTSNKKNLPKTQMNIGPKEVNTGATYRGNCEKIQIWRTEEIKKVLIHEMGHCLEIEFSPPFIKDDNNKKYNNLISHLIHIFNIPLNTEIRIYEAYNEMWALIISTIFSCIEFIENKDYNLNVTFQYFLNLEINFSMFQCAKILNYFKFKKFRDFFSLKGFNNHIRNKTTYKQSSSILSYYIIKSSLLYNVDKFMNYCFEHSIGKLNIKFNENSISEFQKLIDECLSNKSYIYKIDNILKKIDKIDKHGNFQSLRMTIVEL